MVLQCILKGETNVAHCAWLQDCESRCPFTSRRSLKRCILDAPGFRDLLNYLWKVHHFEW